MLFVGCLALLVWSSCRGHGPLLQATTPTLSAGTSTAAVTTSTSQPCTAEDQSNGVSHSPRISADGRLVSFVSAASNLVPRDSNGCDDVFIRDRQLGSTERVSVATSGAQADGSSSLPALSGDGRWVAFASLAGNLVPGDANRDLDVFLRDLQTGSTVRASPPSHESPRIDASTAPALSADGRWLAFCSWLGWPRPAVGNAMVLYLRNGQSGESLRADSPLLQMVGGHFGVWGPSLSSDGRWLAFASTATDALAPGHDINPWSKVYLYDRETATVRPVSMDPEYRNGTTYSDRKSGAPTISADGRWIAFVSEATNLTADSPQDGLSVFLYDRETSTTRWVSSLGPRVLGSMITGSWVSLSADGHWLAYGSDSVYVYDRTTGQSEFLAAGREPSISADGRYVAFTSSDSHLVPCDTNGLDDVFVFDRLTQTLERVSVPQK